MVKITCLSPCGNKTVLDIKKGSTLFALSKQLKEGEGNKTTQFRFFNLKNGVINSSYKFKVDETVIYKKIPTAPLRRENNKSIGEKLARIQRDRENASKGSSNYEKYINEIVNARKESKNDPPNMMELVEKLKSIFICSEKDAKRILRSSRFNLNIAQDMLINRQEEDDVEQPSNTSPYYGIHKEIQKVNPKPRPRRIPHRFPFLMDDDPFVGGRVDPDLDRFMLERMRERRGRPVFPFNRRPY